MAAQQKPDKPAVICCGQAVRNGRCRKCGSEYRLAVRTKDRTRNSQVLYMLESAGGLVVVLIVLAIAAELVR